MPPAPLPIEDKLLRVRTCLGEMKSIQTGLEKELELIRSGDPAMDFDRLKKVQGLKGDAEKALLLALAELTGARGLAPEKLSPLLGARAGDLDSALVALEKAVRDAQHALAHAGDCLNGLGQLLGVSTDPSGLLFPSGSQPVASAPVSQAPAPAAQATAPAAPPAPLAAAPGPAPQAAPPVGAGPAAPPVIPADAPNVLIVDDDMICRAVCRKLLKNRGLNVLEASTIELGLKSLTMKPVRLLILDEFLVDGSGVTLLEQINGKHPEMQVVMLTGMKDKTKVIELQRKLRSRTESPYVRAFWIKPLSQDRVAKLLDRLFSPEALASGIPRPLPFDPEDWQRPGDGEFSIIDSKS